MGEGEGREKLKLTQKRTIEGIKLWGWKDPILNFLEGGLMISSEGFNFLKRNLW